MKVVTWERGTWTTPATEVVVVGDDGVVVSTTGAGADRVLRWLRWAGAAETTAESNATERVEERILMVCSESAKSEVGLRLLLWSW